MKIIRFIMFVDLDGNTYAINQVVAFNDDAQADYLVNEGLAEYAPDETIFVEHISR